ncbi:hypothetical protein SMC26_34945 [Actinomadura fulvescens]|uniref:Uncharacterized protein n=1 Tax=Actinomadura fulvescens TaxID=46160 RepID=A0ABN3PDE6_9ACTN
MSDHSQDTDDEQTPAARWRSLPSHTPLGDTVASQEVPPKPQVIAEPGNVKLDEATRYPV